MKSAPQVVDATCSTCNGRGIDTYRTEADCSNCGWMGEARYSVGHETFAIQARCPACGCSRIRAGQFIEREAVTA